MPNNGNIKARWGTVAHLVFMVFGLAANLIVSAMLLLGGCAVYNAVAGVHITADKGRDPRQTAS